MDPRKHLRLAGNVCKVHKKATALKKFVKENESEMYEENIGKIMIKFSCF